MIKFKKKKDDRIFEEAFRLLKIETEDIEIYQLNDSQKKAISEARQQIKTGNFLTEEQANKDVDEWLDK